MKSVTWQDLFDYLEGTDGCNFREVDDEIEWWCDCTFKFTEKFCKDNSLDFDCLKEICEATGGHCDCEILFNTSEKVPPDEELLWVPEKDRPKSGYKRGDK